MKVPVFVPVKDCALWLPRFLSMLDKLDNVDRVVFSYGKSRDLTLTYILQFKESSRHKVEIYEEPRKLHAVSSGMIGAIYRDFQALMTPDDTHALLIDADIMVAPRNLISRLQRHGKNIIAPYPWVLYNKPRRFYDSYVFREGGHKFFEWDPPHGDEKKPVQLDSVGTCMLVERECFLATPYDDPYPHLRFCDESREKGYEVWADPATKIYHIDLLKLGIRHYPIEALLGVASKNMLYVDSKGKTYTVNEADACATAAAVWGKHNP